MNSDIKILIKLLVLLIFVIIIIAGLFFAKVTNFSFTDLNKDEPSQTQNNKSSKELSNDEIKKIEDSINQREDRIKALKDIGKKLGG